MGCTGSVFSVSGVGVEGGTLGVCVLGVPRGVSYYPSWGVGRPVWCWYGHGQVCTVDEVFSSGSVLGVPRLSSDTSPPSSPKFHSFYWDLVLPGDTFDVFSCPQVGTSKYGLLHACLVTHRGRRHLVRILIRSSGGSPRLEVLRAPGGRGPGWLAGRGSGGVGLVPVRGARSRPKISIK